MPERDQTASDADQTGADLDQTSADADDTASERDLRLRAARDRKRAGESRDRAATRRDAAAADREHAARDRAQASRDRASMSEQLVIEGVDHLTGALRRRTGMITIKREMDRTKRSEEPLLLAFIDVDGLKIINDTRGHPAGDAVLRSVAECLRAGLRSSDVILRFGGDEFICSLAGQDVAGGQQRMDEISAELAEDADGQTITVGLAERRAEESLDSLIVRADTAMIATRNGT